MGNTTGQFHPGNISQQSDPGGLAVLGRTLFYIGNGKEAKKLYVRVCDLSDMDLPAIKDSAAWREYELPASQIQFHDNVAPESDSGVAALTLGNKLFCFWSDTHSSHNSNCYATYTQNASFTADGSWNKHIRLYADMAGSKQLNASEGVIEAFVYDGKVTLLCMANNKKDILVLRYSDNPASLYREGDNWRWLPEHTRTLSADSINGTFSGFRRDDGKIASNFSADWVTDGARNYLMLGCYSSSDGGINLLALVLDEQGLPLNQGKCIWFDNCRDGACIRRDPAGRARLYSGDNSHEIQVATIDTGAGMNVSSNVLFNGASHDLQKSARAIFVTTPNVDGTTAQSHEFVLYADRNDQGYGDILCQAVFFGTLVTDSMCEQVAYSDMLQGAVPYVLESIMEAFPLPADGSNNIAADTELVDVIYGASQSSSTKHSISESLLYGAKTELELTVANVSAVAETSYQAGPTFGEGRSERNTYREEKKCWTSGGAGEIDPRGVVFFSGLSLARDDYYLRDAQGQRVNGGPEMTTIYPLSSSSGSNTFRVYAATPGDLDSYTRDSINARMNSLFPPGCAYRQTYGDWGTDYVGQVIVANALPLGSNGQNYLSFSFSANGEWSTGFHQINSSYTENGWRISEEAWAGLKAEISTDQIFFGLEFKEMFKAMIGSVYEGSSNTATQQDAEWGIKMELTSATQRFSFERPYTIRAYFLPANERWTAELKALAGNVQVKELDHIDAASRPWRIFYEVKF